MIHDYLHPTTIGNDARVRGFVGGQYCGYRVPGRLGPLYPIKRVQSLVPDWVRTTVLFCLLPQALTACYLLAAACFRNKVTHQP